VVYKVDGVDGWAESHEYGWAAYHQWAWWMGGTPLVAYHGHHGWAAYHWRQTMGGPTVVALV
jgi:hypothetical protein